MDGDIYARSLGRGAAGPFAVLAVVSDSFPSLSKQSRDSRQSANPPLPSSWDQNQFLIISPESQAGQGAVVADLRALYLLTFTLKLDNRPGGRGHAGEQVSQQVTGSHTHTPTHPHKATPVTQ